MPNFTCYAFEWFLVDRKIIARVASEARSEGCNYNRREIIQSAANVSSLDKTWPLSRNPSISLMVPSMRRHTTVPLLSWHNCNMSSQTSLYSHAIFFCHDIFSKQYNHNFNVARTTGAMPTCNKAPKPSSPARFPSMGEMYQHGLIKDRWVVRLISYLSCDRGKINHLFFILQTLDVWFEERNFYGESSCWMDAWGKFTCTRVSVWVCDTYFERTH